MDVNNKKPTPLRYRVSTCELLQRVTVQVYSVHKNMFDKTIEIVADRKEFHPELTGFFKKVHNWKQQRRDLCEQASDWAKETMLLIEKNSSPGEYDRCP